MNAAGRAWPVTPNPAGHPPAASRYPLHHGTCAPCTLMEEL
jgi:hypothetical protein